MTLRDDDDRQTWREAARAGALRGIEWAVTVLILGAAVLLLLGDYVVTRQKAALGAEAYAIIQDARARQPAPPPGPSQTPPPK